MQRSATHSNTATQQHSSTAAHAHYQQTAAHGDQRVTYTQTKHAAHTTTPHTQHARQHSCNTQRRRGIAHLPTTASSSVQRSHSAHRTLAALCCSRGRLLQDSGATTLRLRHARSQDKRRTSASHGLPATAAATGNTRATQHRSLTQCNAAVMHTCTQRSATFEHEQSTTT
jgi:hypothetical protein